MYIVDFFYNLFFILRRLLRLSHTIIVRISASFQTPVFFSFLLEFWIHFTSKQFLFSVNTFIISVLQICFLKCPSSDINQSRIVQCIVINPSVGSFVCVFVGLLPR